MSQAMKDEAREIRRKMRQLQETTNTPAASKSAAATKPRVVERKQEPIQQVERVQREVSKPRVERCASAREERSFMAKKPIRADERKQPEKKTVVTAKPVSKQRVACPANNVQEVTNSHAAAWLEQQKKKMRAQFELNKLDPEAFKRQYELVLSPNSKQEKATTDITEQTWLQERKAVARADCEAQRAAIDTHFNTMIAGVEILDENSEPENMQDASPMSPMRRMIDKANATFGRTHRLII